MNGKRCLLRSMTLAGPEFAVISKRLGLILIQLQSLAIELCVQILQKMRLSKPSWWLFQKRHTVVIFFSVRSQNCRISFIFVAGIVRFFTFGSVGYSRENLWFVKGKACFINGKALEITRFDCRFNLAAAFVHFSYCSCRVVGAILFS